MSDAIYSITITLVTVSWVYGVDQVDWKAEHPVFFASGFQQRQEEAG